MLLAVARGKYQYKQPAYLTNQEEKLNQQDLMVLREIKKRTAANRREVAGGGDDGGEQELVVRSSGGEPVRLLLKANIFLLENQPYKST